MKVAAKNKTFYHKFRQEMLNSVKKKSATLDLTGFDVEQLIREVFSASDDLAKMRMFIGNGQYLKYSFWDHKMFYRKI